MNAWTRLEEYFDLRNEALNHLGLHPEKKLLGLVECPRGSLSQKWTNSENLRMQQAKWKPLRPRRDNAQPERLTFTDHAQLLTWLESNDRLTMDLDDVENIHIWSLVALASLAGKAGERRKRIQVLRTGRSAPSRFAHVVGYDAAIGVSTSRPRANFDAKRTVRLQRVKRFEQVESVAAEISRLLLRKPEAEETRRTLYYILVEFLRNAVQHGLDPLGAVVGAQLMDKSKEYKDRLMIQVAVGDAGSGVMRTLQATYPEIKDPHQALTMAQQPWVSSQFARGLRGGKTNAGLGLYFVAEMAKRTAGRFLIASRGGSILLQGDETFQQAHHIQAEGPGFPGTLVVFELPIGEIEDYDGLIATIQDSARGRIPSQTSFNWLRFESSPQRSALRIGVKIGAEDTAHANALVNDHLLPRIAQKQSIEFDFSGLRVCTQSFLHALLFVAVRAAHRQDVPIYVSNASPAVRSAVEFLESYALASETH